MKVKTFTTWLVLLALLAAGAACQLGGKESPSSANPAEATKVSAAESTAPANGGAPSGKATAAVEKPSSGAGSFSLDDFSVGLDKLASYRQSLALGFDGTVSGTETQSKTSLRRTTIRQAGQAEPAAELTWLEIDGGPLQMYARVGETSYRQVGADGVCSAYPTEPQPGDRPAAFQLQTLPALSGASAAGEESINGVAAGHYSFDENAIGRAGEVKAKGDLWVAKEGGYVVKYSLRITGEGDQLGPGVQGTQTWEYQLTDPNAVKEPDLPKGCTVEQGKDIAPLPQEAKDILRMPDFLQFNAALAPEQAAKFYQDQAAALKWEEIAGNPVKDADQILNFKTAEGGLVSIRLHQQEGGTRVTIQALKGKK